MKVKKLMNDKIKFHSPTLINILESALGHEVKIISCPKHCDWGYRGVDACNTCGTTGTGFRVKGKFYPNTEEGFEQALDALAAVSG